VREGGMSSVIPVRGLQFFTIRTRDLSRARRFYVEVLRFPVLEETPGQFFQVSLGGVPICVDYDADFTQQSNQIGIRVGSLEQTAAFLQEQGVSASRGQNAGESWITIQDPDGHEIIFLQDK
jgi:catechol 2,3-dioxygenase-like lactoylglutathione lyase family enzyme